MYRCPNCGGDMQFSPEKQKLVCEYCDSEFTVEEFDKANGVKAEEHKEEQYQEKNDNYFDATVFTCPQCGGEIMSTDDTAATFCSFCGASVLLESRVSKEMKPDYIIPFKKTKEECKTAYKAMVSKALFAPSSLKKDSEVDKFRSIYMPYWVYDYDFHDTISAKGELSHRSGDYIITDHYRIRTYADINYEGIAYDASSSFSDNLSEAVAPFDVKEAKEFKSAYMTGHYADTKDVGPGVYMEDGAKIVKDHAAKIVSANPEFRKHGSSKSDIENAIEPRCGDPKLGFFPVWFLSTRNKKGDRVTYAVMNGQTGRIAADLPVSIGKYLIGSLILGAIFFVLLNFVVDVTFTPKTMNTIAVILGLVALIISNSQMNKVYMRDHNLDDKGYMDKNKITEETLKEAIYKDGKKSKSVSLTLPRLSFKIVIAAAIVAFYLTTNVVDDEMICLAMGGVVLVVGGIYSAVSSSLGKKTVSLVSAPLSEKVKILWKPFVSIVIAIVMYLLNPNEDIIAYAGVLVAMLLIVWAFADIIREHNMLTMRKLPQLGKRGGDL